MVGTNPLLSAQTYSYLSYKKLLLSYKNFQRYLMIIDLIKSKFYKEHSEADLGLLQHPRWSTL